ncbi:MAG: zinc-dependent metalloprotease, partial [Gemmatimonadota bacterium]|nr:zinc-dependent metalloprotease [Gemmatimonadota bacterium]
GGGADYRYALKGDGQTPFTIIEGAEQRDALETVLSTLDVDFLALSDDIISLIPPPAFRHSEGEIFAGYTEQIFDPLAAAEASAAFTVGEILHPQRMARLVLYGSMGDYPDLEEVVDRLIEVTWGADAQNDEYHQRILHAVQRTVIDQMMQQATMEGSAPDVRAILADRLEDIATRLEGAGDPSPHERLAAADIRRWQSRIENTTPGPVIQLPAGDPIGGSPRGGSPR